MNKNNKHKIFISIFILIFLFCNLIAQNKQKINKSNSKQPLYIETHVFPSESNFNCIVSYKITYSNIVFVKENSHYSSGYTISFEIYENEKFVKRIYGSNKIISSNYTETMSENIFSDGFILFSIEKGKYTIKPSIILNNTDIEAIINPIELLVDSLQIYKPFFVKKEIQFCDSSKYQLANFQNSIPFSDEQYDMLIPSFAEKEESIDIELVQQYKNIIKAKVDNFIFLNKKIEVCNGKVVFNANSNLPLLKFFKVDFVNQKLEEGEFEIFIKNETNKVKFQPQVLWFEKPKSLSNIEEAIGYLRIIGLNKKADSLLNLTEEKEYNALYNFWKKYDDDTLTEFNSVFDQFYSRIDYVKKEFNSVGKKDAIETDRGKTYINFGKPDNIIRTFNEVNDVIEVWEYNALNKKIYFSDKTGTGKFERIK